MNRTIALGHHLGIILLVALPVGLGGCAASAGTTGGASASSSGGEAPPAGKVVMRTTTPIAVPKPGKPRESLSPAVQQVWERVEIAVAIPQPAVPKDSNLEAIDAWAKDVLRPWLERKIAAVRHAEEPTKGIEGWPLEERGVAAGLLGYLYESIASGLRGSPVPVTIANDPELLKIYVDALQEALSPAALEAAKAYASCTKSLLPVVRASSANPSPWLEWAEYCASRAQEIATVYELKVARPAAQSEAATGTSSPPAAGSATTPSETAPAETSAAPAKKPRTRAK